jgi:hypothetical protein
VTVDYDAVANRFLAEPGVTEGHMFGNAVLKIGGKVFAGLWDGQLVVKLPAARVDALIAAGKGSAFEPMPDRAMREWVLVGDDEELAAEALVFVSVRPQT